MLDVQEASGVLATLMAQPIYFFTYSLPDGIKTKEQYKLNFYARSTIPWKLKCEGEIGKSRPEVVKILQGVSDETSMVSGIRGGYFIMTGALFFVLQIFFACAHCMCECSCLRRPNWKFTHSNVYIFYVLIQIGLLVGGFVMASNFVKENDAKFVKYETYTVVNGCSDSSTVLPQEDINAALETAHSTVKRVVVGLVIVIVLVIIHYGLVVLTACYIKRKYPSETQVKEQDPDS